MGMSDPKPSTGEGKLLDFPQTRLRRLRGHAVLRDLVRETHLRPADLILPLFVRPGRGIRREIASMPGNYQLSPDTLVEEVRQAADLGVSAFLLFGIPGHKDATGSSALADNGIVQEGLRRVREALGDKVYLITDECFCEYTDHGHCGVLREKGGKLDLDNDATLPLLGQQCVSHVQAGADMVAPSGMLDGMVGAIRTALDQAGCQETPILSYAAKYSSAFYGPFRDAAESPPQFGDRSSYQMDPANSDEAAPRGRPRFERGGGPRHGQARACLSRHHSQGKGPLWRAGGRVQCKRRVRHGEGRRRARLD